MTALLRKIIADCMAIDLTKIPPPKGELPEGAHIVGVMGDDLRRLWHLRREVGLRFRDTTHRHAVLCIGEEEMSADHEQLHKDLFMDEELMKSLNTLFWSSLYYEFPDLATMDKIHVCADWRVVWTEASQSKQVILLDGPLAEALGKALARS